MTSGPRDVSVTSSRRRISHRRRVAQSTLVIALLAPLAPMFTPSVGASSASHVAVSPSAQCPWIGESLQHHGTASQWAAQVAARMTPDELANFVVLQTGAGIENFNIGVPRLCVPELTLVDGPSGVGANALGVTQFPSELAVAASFNTATARQVGFAMAQEALTKGYDVLQAPDLNLIRSPLSGRAFETYGEDPYLAGAMGVAAIRGIQSTGVMAQAKHLGAYTQENGRARIDQLVSRRALAEIYDLPFRAAVTQAHVASIMCAMGAVNGRNTCSSPWLYATLKSWGFHGFVRSDYNAVTAPVGAFRTGLSLIKPATPAQVLAGLSSGALRVAVLRHAVASVLTEMFAYGLVNRPRSLALSARATSVAHLNVALRAARQGIVLLKNADHVLPLANAGSLAVIGVDARTGVTTRGGGSSGVHASSLETPLAALRKVLRHVHISYSAGGLSGIEYDPLKITDITAGSAPLKELPITLHGEPGKADLAIDYAAQVTPAALTATSPGTGEGWSHWTVTFRAERTGTYALGLEDVGDTWLSMNGRVVLADRGVHGPFPQSTSVRLRAGQSYTLSAQWFSLNAATQPRFGIDYVQPEINAAVAAARRAHTAVVFASNLLTEGADQNSLLLPGSLNALISAVAAANPRTVVVLNTGGPVVMPWKSKVAGIVEAWYGGQMAAPAMAQVLAGVVDPSGRLPVTMPGSTWQTPAADAAQYPGRNGVVNFAGLSALGYRWYQANNVTPAYPFGYGLSYTSFAWSRVAVSRAGGGVRVSLDVTNTGARPGVDVVEVYVSYPSGLGEPPSQLRGFASVALGIHATHHVVIDLARSAFTSFNGRSLAVVPGAYGVNVATSSANFVATQTVNFAS
ncbi:MAG: glycoside hydrolase family 3 C-terminal domain-containing protein [Acidobacteriota bacterium]|nr:glycoside hydrolase family 3 C-terminal domain-containing protein [Acidobacteriota bacterium]